MRVSLPPLPVSVSFPVPPVSTLFSEFPVRVLLSAPPVTFSMAFAADNVSVRLEFTTWAAVLERSTATDWVVVCEKSSVSVPLPTASMIEVLPRGELALNE